VNRTTGVQNGWSEAVRRNFTPYYTIESQTSAKLFGSSAVCRVTHHRGRRGKKTASLSASIAGWEFARTTTTGRWRYATSHLMTQVSTGLPLRTNLEKYKPQLDSKCWVSIYLRSQSFYIYIFYTVIHESCLTPFLNFNSFKL